MADADTRLLMLIGEEPAQSRRLAALAARDGWRAIIAHDAETAIASLDSPEGMKLSAIILDRGASSNDACDLVGALRGLRPTLPILMLTNDGSPQLAVEAMRAGATDYLVKPVAAERLLRALSAAAMPRDAEELQPLTEKMPGTLGFEDMIGSAPNFRAALAIAAKAARSHNPVLIAGEGGTGKETLARAMHAVSPRARLPLRFVSVAGFPASQIASVLFGHEKGAFPGAFDRQIGAFQHADGGTLVLDEVDQLSPPAQEKLLRFLSHGDIQPIGARHRFRIDVRLLVCSGAKSSELRERATFGDELLRLLAPIEIELPPLRNRLGDIPTLTRHFLAQIGEQPGLRPLAITHQALTLLARYDWPGNVRQLQAVLFRAAVFCDGDALTADDFPNLAALVADTSPTEAPPPESGGVMLFGSDGHIRPMEEIEADVIRLAVGHYHGRMSEVARRLGIGRSTLYRKLADLGIDNAA